jgi:hypothetical protein
MAVGMVLTVHPAACVRGSMGLQHCPKDKRVAVAKKGGAAGGHRFTSEEARAAAQKPRKKKKGRKGT